MTASATPSAGTDAQEPRRPKLTQQSQARLDAIKARNALVVAINGVSWGSALTARQQNAFAEFIRRFRLDISEIDNLGGRPYRNGRYYMRRGAELTREGRLLAFFGEHIGPDERLAKMAGDESAVAEDRKWAHGEQLRRDRLRIIHAVPATATHAYLVTLTMKVGETDKAVTMQGCKWYVPGRTKKVWRKPPGGGRGVQVEVSADPVGDENPITSVETRAWRRAGRLAFAEIPELREEEELMERAADDTQAAVVAEAVRAEEEDERNTITTHPIDHGGDDPYGTGAAASAPLRALGEGAAQPVPVPSQGERVASTVPDSRTPSEHDHGPELEFQDDTDLMDD